MNRAGLGGLPSWLVESLSDWEDSTCKPWRVVVSVDDDDVTLCGSCSDDMGDAFDAWPDAVAELAAGDRVPCGRCGA